MFQHTWKPAFESVCVVFRIAHWSVFLSKLSLEQLASPSATTKPTHLHHPSAEAGWDGGVQAAVTLRAARWQPEPPV